MSHDKLKKYLGCTDNGGAFLYQVITKFEVDWSFFLYDDKYQVIFNRNTPNYTETTYDVKCVLKLVKLL